MEPHQNVGLHFDCVKFLLECQFLIFFQGPETPRHVLPKVETKFFSSSFFVGLLFDFATF